MMPQFVLRCRDRKDSLDLRLATRAAHLDYVAAAKVKVLLAGPTLDADGNPNGSLFILEATDESDIREFAENDPYETAGLFADAEISLFKIVAGALTQTET